MMKYEFSSGADLHAPDHWPAASGIPRVSGKATLVVFAHPRCPCTEATFDELTAIAPAAGSGTSVVVIFFTPPGAGTEWTQAPSVRRAAAIPGVTIHTDENGREARLFHAATSGRTLLYAPDGRRIFDGGITASRGVSGRNAGADSLAASLSGGELTHSSTPVFGCPIFLKPSAR